MVAAELVSMVDKFIRVLLDINNSLKLISLEFMSVWVIGQVADSNAISGPQLTAEAEYSSVKSVS